MPNRKNLLIPPNSIMKLTQCFGYPKLETPQSSIDPNGGGKRIFKKQQRFDEKRIGVCATATVLSAREGASFGAGVPRRTTEGIVLIYLMILFLL